MHGRTARGISYSLIVFGLKSEVLIDILNDDSFNDVVNKLEDVVKKRSEFVLYDFEWSNFLFLKFKIIMRSVTKKSVKRL